MKVLDRELIILFTINVAVGLTSQLIQPLFPLYLKEIGATDLQNAFIISLGNLSATIMMLPGGLLMNKFGKRSLLMLSMVLSGGSVLLMGFTRNWTLVTPLNILLNISLCFFIPSRMALIAEHATPANRATLFGLMNLAWPISGLVGPLAGGYLAESYGWGVVFIIAALISFLAIYPAMLVNKEKQGIERFSSEPRRRSSILDKRYLLTMSILFALQTCVATSMAGINMILPIYLQDRFNLSYALIGAFFTGSNVLLIFTQIGGGYLADRHGHRKILLLCAALAPFAIGSWILFDNWVALFAVYSIAFGLWSLSWPPILAMLTELLPAELRGTGFGLNMTGSRLGFTLGPIVAGLLYVVPGSSTPFIAAALIYALAFPLTYLLKDRKSDETVSKNQTFFL